MAEEEGIDWDEPLPTSSTTLDGEEEEIAEEVKREQENLKKLEMYVERMAYRPTAPPCVTANMDKLATPRKTDVVSTYTDYGHVQKPTLRKDRLKRVADKYNTISTEQLEQIIKMHKMKERKKDDLLKRKQELYYDMLTKLERQCRTQYLNVLIKKFANFIAKLATTMHIPPQLVEPYARMQRGIFCNILLAIGVQPANQAAIYYNSEEALEYEVCHKLAHALLSLIIKALDFASTRNPEDVPPLETDFEMDNYIKDRLMCAAEKKLLYKSRKRKQVSKYSRACLKNMNEFDQMYKCCNDFDLDHEQIC